MSGAVENRPIVKAWACKVIAAVYLHQEGVKWNRKLTPGIGTGQKPNPEEEPFWALFAMMDYKPTSGENLTGDAKVKWEKDGVKQQPWVPLPKGTPPEHSLFPS